jgi:lipopolysaccharide/colanic/teichoic acid biosynthesis glycosyltransferase
MITSPSVPSSLWRPEAPSETATVPPLRESDAALSAELLYLRRASHWTHQCQQLLKRAFDIAATGAGLLLILPGLLLIALAVRLDSPGPVLYKSERIGRNGRRFPMYKFRTMTTNADALRDQLRQEANLENGLFKMKDDPRVTRLGRVLRALSLDELPQLLNVLRGDMSLVGPRPLPPDESALFKEPYTLRFQVYPGITGAWQVGGRSNLSFEALCRLELDYILRWSLLSDARILLKTPFAVLASRGAY